MKFINSELKTKGKFLNYYLLKYKNKNGNDKYYEMISRDENIQSIEDLKSREPQAVVLMILNKSHDKILLNKEFRMAIGDYIYGSVAGLIEKGETIENAARRELKEETGLDLIKILDILPPAYTATGISNEKTICLFCEASGTIDVSNEEPDEDIEPQWFSKDELKELFKSPNSISMAARSQMFCYMWMNGGIF